MHEVRDAKRIALHCATDHSLSKRVVQWLDSSLICLGAREEPVDERVNGRGVTARRGGSFVKNRCMSTADNSPLYVL